MNGNPLRKLRAYGQSICLDFIRRSMLVSVAPTLQLISNLRR